MTKMSPMKRLSMRIGGPPSGIKVPPGGKVVPNKGGPNQAAPEKKSLLPARRLSTSRTLA
jgi:hypothetical protein